MWLCGKEGKGGSGVVGGGGVGRGGGGGIDPKFLGGLTIYERLIVPLKAFIKKMFIQSWETS